MTVRTDGNTLPAFLLRFFMAPVALGALFATAAAILHRRARRPPKQRMSEEWLRNHDVDYRRDLPW
jgi:hypothetical protein